MQSNLRLWYRTLSDAHQDINKRLHFHHLFLALPSEILKYFIMNYKILELSKVLPVTVILNDSVAPFPDESTAS